MVVGEDEVKKVEGGYLVNDSWMLRRLQAEQALEAALERCENN